MNTMAYPFFNPMNLSPIMGSGNYNYSFFPNQQGLMPYYNNDFQTIEKRINTLENKVNELEKKLNTTTKDGFLEYQSSLHMM